MKKYQIEVFIFKVVKGEKCFLMMKRVASRGGFWQPLTGGVEDGESLMEAIVREIEEETGIVKCVQIVDSGFSFEFSDRGKDFVEYVYAAEVDGGTVINLSHEHSEYKWVTKDVALSMLKWEDNKKGLETVCAVLQD